MLLLQTNKSTYYWNLLPGNLDLWGWTQSVCWRSGMCYTCTDDDENIETYSRPGLRWSDSSDLMSPRDPHQDTLNREECNPWNKAYYSAFNPQMSLLSLQSIIANRIPTPAVEKCELLIKMTRQMRMKHLVAISVTKPNLTHGLLLRNCMTTTTGKKAITR